MATLNKYLNNKFLKTLEPLSKLSIDKLSELVNKSSIETIPAGRNLFRQGEKDRLSYYLVSGQIELLKSGDSKSETIKAKTPEAKYPIAQQLPRPSTARTKVNSEVLSIDTSLLEMLIESDDNPSGAYEVTEINSEDENGWMLKFLQSRAFLQIPTENIQKILMSMKEIKVSKGQSIVQQGESNDYYYIVKTGKCSVSRRPSPNAEDVQIAILAAGDGFGEEALITEGHRNATVRMLENGHLMRLTKDDFISLLVRPLLDYIHLDELKSRASSGDLLVDVRQHKDFMSEHLEGAVNIPLSMIRLKLSTFNDDRNVIVYCNDANRSTAAAFLLIQNGVTCSILKDGINSHGTHQASKDSTNSSMTDIIANLDAVTNKENDTTKTNSTVKPVTSLNKSIPPKKSTQDDTSASQTDKIKKQIEDLNSKNIQAETARKHAEKDQKRLENEAKKLKEKAEADRIAAQRELQKVTDEYNNHKQAIESKEKAEREAQVLLQQAEKEKLAAEQELERQENESRKNKRIIDQKHQAEREAIALREKAESEKLNAERELQKQKEFIDAQLKKQQQIADESRKQVKLETEKVRLQADKELALLREELDKTKNSVKDRVKALKEKESQQAEEEIRNRQQHANAAIKESIEKARLQAEAEAEKVRQQALLEVHSIQKEIELKKQELKNEAENIRLEAERDRAATLELARKQAQEIVFRTTEEAEFINIQRQELDTETAKIQLQAEAERHKTLEAAKLEAQNIIRKTAEEAQQLDLQRQRIEDEVAKIKSEAEFEKEQAINLAKQDANKIRSEAEKNAQLQAKKEIENVRNKTLQQTKELKEQRSRLKLQAQKELEQQRSTMEISLKKAEKIRVQAEKEAEKIRMEALMSASQAQETNQHQHVEEITIEDAKATDNIENNHSDVSFSDINIPGSIANQEPSMVESEAKTLAQEIVSKLEKAESNRIKEKSSESKSNGLTLASASLKRRSDGKIVLEGDEDIFIFKEPETCTEEELNNIKESLEGKSFKQTTPVQSNKTTQSTDSPEFSLDEPDFDLVDELPSQVKSSSEETPISEFSDFELHQPSDLRHHNKSVSKRPAQRIVAIAASLFVAIGVGVTFIGVNSEQSESQDIAMQKDNSFNATRVSGLATNNIEIDKKIMKEAEHEFEKLLSKWKKSQAKQESTKSTADSDQIAK